jgi:hypothetical protein
MPWQEQAGGRVIGGRSILHELRRYGPDGPSADADGYVLSQLCGWVYFCESI